MRRETEDGPLGARLEALAGQLRGELIERHRQAAIDEAGPPPPVGEQLAELIDERAGLLSEASREQLRSRVLRETVGLGPLEELLDDDAIDEVLVNGHREVWIEREGRLERARRGSRASRSCSTWSSASSARSAAGSTSSARSPTGGCPTAPA